MRSEGGRHTGAPVETDQEDKGSEQDGQTRPDTGLLRGVDPLRGGVERDDIKG